MQTKLQKIERTDEDEQFIQLMEERLDHTEWELEHQCAGGYAWTFKGWGGENAAVAMISWGQDGTARVAVVQSAVDGGCRGKTEFASGNFKTHVEIVDFIVKQLRDRSFENNYQKH